MIELSIVVVIGGVLAVLGALGYRRYITNANTAEATYLEEAASRWRAQPGTDLLLRGRPLRDARALHGSRRQMLTDEVSAFVAASRKNELRSSAGVIGLTSSVFVFAAVLAVFYWQSSRETEAAKRAANQEKVEVAKITKTLINSRNRTKTQQELDIEEMLVEKRACEKQLAACADAGAR